MRLIFTLVFFGIFSNCGFQPIVGKNLDAPRFQQYIKIDQPKDRKEFIVREHLFRLLDPTIEEKYLLSFSTNISSNTGIVTKENQTTRYILNSTYPFR